MVCGNACLQRYHPWEPKCEVGKHQGFRERQKVAQRSCGHAYQIPLVCPFFTVSAHISQMSINSLFMFWFLNLKLMVSATLMVYYLHGKGFFFLAHLVPERCGMIPSPTCNIPISCVTSLCLCSADYACKGRCYRVQHNLLQHLSFICC